MFDLHYVEKGRNGGRQINYKYSIRSQDSLKYRNSFILSVFPKRIDLKNAYVSPKKIRALIAAFSVRMTIIDISEFIHKIIDAHKGSMKFSTCSSH